MKKLKMSSSVWILLAALIALSVPWTASQAEAGPQPHLKLFGMTRAQTARMSVFNRGDRNTVTITIDYFDSDGVLLGESGEITLAPGAMMSFDLSGDLPGHPRDGFGRVQLRGETKTLGGPDTKVVATLEVIDNVTGKTTILMCGPEV